MKTKRTVFWAASLGAALCGLLVTGWLAQDRAVAQPPEEQTQPGFPGGFGGRPGPPGMMRPPMSGSLVVSGKYVYVLFGNTLYQFSAEDLTELKRVKLEVEMPAFPPPPPGPAGEEGGEGQE